LTVQSPHRYSRKTLADRNLPKPYYVPMVMTLILIGTAYV